MDQTNLTCMPVQCTVRTPLWTLHKQVPSPATQVGGNDYLNKFDNLTDAFNLNFQLSTFTEAVVGCVLVGAKLQKKAYETQP